MANAFEGEGGGALGFTGFNSYLFYSIDPSNWYKTYPFVFEVRKNRELQCRFFLPIPPQNYTIQDMSTAEAHATIGGVVEEINKPVFSMITLVGTTGLSINSPFLGNGVEQDLTINQRKMLDEITRTNTFAGKILSQLRNNVSDLISLSFTEQETSLPYQDAPSSVNTPSKGALTQLFNPTSGDTENWLEKMNPFKKIDIPNTAFTNGWAWSQALRQFFLIYQRERSEDSALELYFSDYKSNTTYRCVPRSAQFQQNANTPYLINYTIILKCWNLLDANAEFGTQKDINRFDTDLKEVNTASITGVVSKVGKIANNLNRFPSVAGSFLRNSTGSFL
ncbi:MAG: hypothetical protein EBU90_22895 [Proteobacteria bacterium]|nr:hypothetical protein [Pseudomonadota bacterium]